MDRTTDTDTGVEQAEETKPAERPPPPDRPGQEPEGVPSRLEARKALAAEESGHEASDAHEDARRNDPTEARSDNRPAPSSSLDAENEDRPPDRTDRSYEVKAPQIVQDYYTNIPPTAQDRYLIRDQSNPVPLFNGPPARDQVIQNDVGDCGVIATLGAAAGHRPDAVRGAIKQVGEGEYEITLHEVVETTPADPVSRPTGEVKIYRVNDEFPVRTDDPTRPLTGAGADSCGWPALMEKVIAAEDQTWEARDKAEWKQAWATWHKPRVDHDRGNAGLEPSPEDAPTGYNRLDLGSNPYQWANLLTKLTGENAEVRRIPGDEQRGTALLDTFRERLDAHKPVLVGSRSLRTPTELFPNAIVPGHAYEVVGIENEKIHLRNPWGYGNPTPMDTKTFLECYRSYNRDGTRDGYYATLT